MSLPKGNLRDNRAIINFNYEKVLIPEMNLGQLAMLIKAKYLKDVVSYTMVKGLPFTTQELIDAAKGALDV